MVKKKYKQTSPGKKTIFIVEDNELYARTLKTFISSRFPQIKRIVIFSIGEMCLRQLNRKPGIIIIDYFLDSKYGEAQNGLEIIKRIRTQTSQTNIIVLSIQKDLDVILEAIEQYDCSYVQKDDDAFHKIEQTINEIFNRENMQVLEWHN